MTIVSTEPQLPLPHRVVASHPAATLFAWVELPIHADERGWLVAVESGDTLPFEIRRAYYIGGTPAGTRRGGHAHKRSLQAAVCVRGGCSFVFDDGGQRMEARLDDPARALIIPRMMWHEMFDFTEDCALIVFADTLFDEADYVRDYGDFLNMVRG